MASDGPTILATSGGTRHGARTELELAPLVRYALELAGVDGRAPRLCHVGTAGGDRASYNAALSEAGRVAGVRVSHLNVFPMPNVADASSFLREHDAVWVSGGSVVNLLALWRIHGVDAAMRDALDAGVVLAGSSAGSICWHSGGTTDSFGPELRVVTDGLGFLGHSNGVHHDSEPARRPLFEAAVASGRLSAGFATDDGVGLLYRDGALAEVVAEVAGAAAYRVARVGDRAVAERLEPRLLPDPA